jgi:hypothetical protein
MNVAFDVEPVRSTNWASEPRIQVAYAPKEELQTRPEWWSDNWDSLKGTQMVEETNRVIWSDCEVAMNQVACQGASEEDSVVMHLCDSFMHCPEGRTMEHITDSEYLYGKWRSILENNIYDGANTEHCALIRDMLQQKRVLGITLGKGEEYGRLSHTAELYCRCLMRAEENLSRGVDAELIQCPP